MTDPRIASLEEAYAQWSEGNWSPRFDFYADDMEWGWSDEFPDLGGVYRDPEVRNERLRRWLGPWETWRAVAEEYLTNHDYVVVLTRYTGRGRGSGVEVDSLGAHVWTFRGDEAVRLEVFSSREMALSSAGIDPSGRDAL